MQSLIEKEFGGEKPEVWVWSESKRTERSEDLVRRVPFVSWGGYFRAEKHVAAGQQVFVHGKPWLLRNWNGFDLFFAFNAPLGWGTSLEKICPDWSPNWNYALELTDEDERYGEDFRKKHGPYIPLSFFGHSFYAGWLKHFGLKDIQFLVSQLFHDYTIVLTGCEWDIPFMRQIRGPVEDLVNQTSMGQLLGLYKHADAAIGFAAGNLMLAQHLGCRTFMLWDPDQWCRAFMTNWVDPLKLLNTYHPLDIKQDNLFRRIPGRIKE